MQVVMECLKFIQLIFLTSYNKKSQQFQISLKKLKNILIYFETDISRI